MAAKREGDTSLQLVEAQEVELRRSSSSKARFRHVDTPVPWEIRTGWDCCWYSMFSSCCCLVFTRFRSSSSRARLREVNRLHASSLSAPLLISVLLIWITGDCSLWLAAPGTAGTKALITIRTQSERKLHQISWSVQQVKYVKNKHLGLDLRGFWKFHSLKCRLDTLTQRDYWLGVGCFAPSSSMFDKLSVACLEVVWRFERRTFHSFSFIEGPTRFGMPIGAGNEFGSLSINRK